MKVNGGTTVAPGTAAHDAPGTWDRRWNPQQYDIAKKWSSETRRLLPRGRTADKIAVGADGDRIGDQAGTDPMRKHEFNADNAKRRLISPYTGVPVPVSS